MLRRALERHGGVSDVDIDQVRAELACVLKPPATFSSISAAASRAGLRLTQAGESTREVGVDPRVWWAGWLSAGFLLLAVVVQFLGSEERWTSLVTDTNAPLTMPALLAYICASAAAAVVILPKTIASLRHGRLDMNVLVVIAAAGATWLGEVSEAATVASLFAGAQLLESVSAVRARRAVGTLMQGHATHVLCQQDGSAREIPVGQVTTGTLLIIRPGERIPVDGEIVAGSSSVDESALTGEPTYVHRVVGDRLGAGSINGSGALELCALAPASQSELTRMLVAAEQQRRNQTSAERWVESFARVYTPLVVGLALLVWLVPTLAGLGDAQEWFRRGLVVTLVACPCALVVSTPLTIVAAISTAARAGILVKGGEHLERCASLGAVAFDKTGVATTGRLKVVSFEVMAPFDERRTLEHVVAVEARSEHPLATALIEFAATRGVQAGSVGGHDVHAIPGLGLEGQVGERDFWIGSARFLAQRTTVSPAVEQAIAALYACGLTVVACGSGSDVWAIFGALDRTRDDAVAAARGLRTRGISRLVLLSGDHAAAVRASATLMEVGDVRGECTPGDKAQAIRQLKEGGPTAMVGDGINDVPALAAASLGIAVGPRATDAALEAADIVIVDDDLSRLPWLIDHARRTMAVVRQNVWCAVALKIAFMLAASAGHATLWMAVLADTGATLLVTINGLRMLHDRSLSDSHAHRQHHHHQVHHQPPVHLHEHAHH